MKSIRIGWIPILVAVIYGCRKDVEFVETSYHVIVIAGQSNTHFALKNDSVQQPEEEHILQLGRQHPDNFKLKPATEPLDHFTKSPNRIGFGLTFAQLYRNAFMKEEEKLILIPAGHTGSGFQKNDWNRGDKLYNDTQNRIRYVLRKHPNSKLAAILWHQGESDIGNPNYQAQLDQFITDFRNGINHPEVPFILGGMVPYWTQQENARVAVQNLIKTTPERVEHTGYADPTYPILIEKEENAKDTIHYDAPGIRELGLRYFSAYTALKP